MASPVFPFYFAWAYESERTFGPEHEVMDEDIFSFTIKHEEGQIPTLDIEVKNPRIGLLNPGRKVWAWFSWQNTANGHVEPLFFGVLVGVPTSLFQEKITLKFIARAPSYIEDKQAVAETMKISPYYDPVFLKEEKRDEPDSILEGWSKLWHVDRTTLKTTASDVLVGEDGTKVFYGMDDAFYKSLTLTLGQPPLNNIRVEAMVQWTQRTSGLIVIPTVNVASYTGDTFMGDWPKPGASLGGGYKVEYSYVTDVFHVAQTPPVSGSMSETFWGDNGDCATASFSESWSFPALLSPNPLSGMLTLWEQTGVCNPGGNPLGSVFGGNTPSNIPAKSSMTGQIVPLWVLNCDMTLRYEAKRTFSESLAFDVIANTQAVLTSPTVQQNTELISISGANVGEPLRQIYAWSDFANHLVGMGVIIFPNDPTKPGGLSHQVCVQQGTAASTEPVFSDIPGTITIDGTVHWSSMGLSPLASAPDWTSASYVPLGEIICYQEQVFNLDSGDFEPQPNSTTYYLCTGSGQTNAVNEQYSYVPPTKTSDEGTPAPIIIDRILPPTFTTTPGAIIVDGSVVWFCLGTSPPILQIPIGGTPSNGNARGFFPGPWGQSSVKYLIAKARARLRIRARAVTVGWDCPISYAVGLSCRMNATIHEPRLPGGTATGKITSYTLTGGQGKFRGHVEIGVAVGFEGAVTADPGVGSYASAGYMQSGYQQMTGEIDIFPDADIGYTPPAFTPFDDGVSFPIMDIFEVSERIRNSDGTSHIGEFNMSAGTPSATGIPAHGQAALIEASFPIARKLAQLSS